MLYIEKLLKPAAVVLAVLLSHGAALAQIDPVRVGTQLISAATDGTISGKLVDAKKAPVSYATVTLLRPDSSVVNGDLSKDDGTFSISPTGKGNFLLRIESIGVATRFLKTSVTADTLTRKMGNIDVIASETTLKTANIVGEKPVVQLTVDKKVFNVEKNITSAGGNASDVLQNVPSVSVDMEGNVSLRGKTGVNILIDGKPATLLGSDVNSALQSMPASSIESVEVISNPSAKYDAAGTTGIINIITKKDGRLGINGNVTLGAGTRDKYNGNAGLNIKKGKWSAFMNLSFRLNNTFNNVTTDRTDKVADSAGILRSYHTYEHVPRHFNGSFNSIGFTYDFNKYNSITVTQNVNVMDFGYSDQSDYYVYNNVSQAGVPAFHQNRYSAADGGPLSLSSAIDYKHKFKKQDEELSIDGTYAVSTIERTNTYKTINDSFGIAQTYFPVYQNAPGGGGNNTFNAWADYTNPLFTKNGKLGLGVKTQLYWFNSSNNPTVDTTGKAQAVDSTLFTRYDYTQQIHAAYINWSDQLDKFSYQVGLRAEDAEYGGTYIGRSSAKLKNSFFNFFPSAFISWQLPKQQSVYLNYSRRTNRPNFFQLLPYLDLSNPSTVSTGNPDLIPEFINNIEFSYNKLDKKGNNIIGSVYYQYTQNLTERITSPGKNEFADRLVVKPQNIASGTTYGAEVIGNLKLTKIWDATVNANFFRNQLVIGDNNQAEFAKYFSNRSGFGWFGKVNTSIKLPANFSLQFNGNFESPKVIAQGNVRESYWLDVAVRKNLLKNKATLVINCADVFKTRQFINDYTLTAFYQTINRVKETRIGNITFTYRFGKTDFGKNIAMDSGGGRRKDRAKEDGRSKTNQPNAEDRGKNMKEGDDDQGGGGQPQGGGQKNK
ncbi:MAG: TonB-dependent receptor [Taibaiella sp.]|nr:TonB-dependent receptor [Taibaiella sp.]